MNLKKWHRTSSLASYSLLFYLIFSMLSITIKHFPVFLYLLFFHSPSNQTHPQRAKDFTKIPGNLEGQEPKSLVFETFNFLKI